MSNPNLVYDDNDGNALDEFLWGEGKGDNVYGTIEEATPAERRLLRRLQQRIALYTNPIYQFVAQVATMSGYNKSLLLNENLLLVDVDAPSVEEALERSPLDTEDLKRVVEEVVREGGPEDGLTEDTEESNARIGVSASLFDGRMRKLLDWASHEASRNDLMVLEYDFAPERLGPLLVETGLWQMIVSCADEVRAWSGLGYRISLRHLLQSPRVTDRFANLVQLRLSLAPTSQLYPDLARAYQSGTRAYTGAHMSSGIKRSEYLRASLQTLRAYFTNVSLGPNPLLAHLIKQSNELQARLDRQRPHNFKLPYDDEEVQQYLSRLVEIAKAIDTLKRNNIDTSEERRDYFQLVEAYKVVEKKDVVRADGRLQLALIVSERVDLVDLGTLVTYYEALRKQAVLAQVNGVRVPKDVEVDLELVSEALEYVMEARALMDRMELLSKRLQEFAVGLQPTQVLVHSYVPPPPSSKRRRRQQWEARP